MEKLKRLLAQRYLLTPAISLLIGIYLHLRGYHMNSHQQDWVQHEIAAIFDFLTLVSGQSSIRYSLSREKQKQITKAVDHNADVINPASPVSNPVKVEEIK